ERDVQLRRDRLAGLADLELSRVVPRVDRRTGGADRGTERVGERLDDLLEVLRRRDAAAAGDDDRRLGELRTVAAHDGLTAGDLAGVLGRSRDLDVFAG